jgi:hypothetical protein
MVRLPAAATSGSRRQEPSHCSLPASRFGSQYEPAPGPAVVNAISVLSCRWQCLLYRSPYVGSKIVRGGAVAVVDHPSGTRACMTG